MKIALYPLVMTLAIAVADLAVFPWLIRWLQQKRFTQYVREEGPQSHKAKQGTPVGGGIALVCDLLVAAVVYLLAAQPHRLSGTDLAAFAFIAVNVLSGFLDDFLKELKRTNTGLLGYQKLLIQATAAVLFFVLAYPTISPRLHLIGGGVIVCGAGWLFYAIAALYAMGMVNAFNLTDGLDGLLAKTSMPVFAVAALASLLHPIGLAGVFPFAALAFCISFLWYNGSKASIFMGDLGSLALGSIFVAWAFISGYEVSSLLLGGLFLIEAASVIIQVSVFKASGRKKRVFLMAPIHHHFEKLGWAEPKIVDRFFVISMLFVLAGALTMVWR